jgi:hypothetical protein
MPSNFLGDILSDFHAKNPAVVQPRSRYLFGIFASSSEESF